MRTSAFFLIMASVMALSIFSIGMLIHVSWSGPSRTVELRGMEGEIYFENCASCHGRNGSGETAAGLRLRTPDLRAAHFQTMSADQLIEDMARTEPHSTLKLTLGKTEMQEAILFVRGLK